MIGAETSQKSFSNEVVRTTLAAAVKLKWDPKGPLVVDSIEKLNKDNLATLLPKLVQQSTTPDMVVDPNVLLSVPESVLSTWLTQLSKSLETYWSTVMHEVFGHACILYDAIPADDKIALILLLGDTTELPKSVIRLIDPSLTSRFIETKYLNWEWFRETLKRGDSIFSGVLTEALGVLGGPLYDWIDPLMAGADNYKPAADFNIVPDLDSLPWKMTPPQLKAIRHLNVKMNKPCSFEDARLLKKAIDKEDYITMSSLVEKYTGRKLQELLLFFGLLLEDDSDIILPSSSIGLEMIGIRALGEIDLEIEQLEEDFTKIKNQLDNLDNLHEAKVGTPQFEAFKDWFRRNRNEMVITEEETLSYYLRDAIPSFVRTGTHNIFWIEWKEYKEVFMQYCNIEEKLQDAYFEKKSAELKLKRDAVSKMVYIENEIYDQNASMERAKAAILKGAATDRFSFSDAEFVILMEEYMENQLLYDPKTQGEEAVTDLLKEHGGYNFATFTRVLKYFKLYAKAKRKRDNLILELNVFKKDKKKFQTNTFFILLAIWLAGMAYVLLQHIYPASIEYVTKTKTAWSGIITDVYNATQNVPILDMVVDIASHMKTGLDHTLQNWGWRTFDTSRLHPSNVAREVLISGRWSAAGLSIIIWRSGAAAVNYTFRFGWALSMAASRITTELWHEGSSVEAISNELSLFVGDLKNVSQDLIVTLGMLLTQLKYVKDVEGQILLEGLKTYITFAGPGSVLFPGMTRLFGPADVSKLHQQVAEYVRQYSVSEEEPVEATVQRVRRRRRRREPQNNEGSSNNDNNAPAPPPRSEYSRAASSVARDEDIEFVEAEEDDEDELSRQMAAVLRHGGHNLRARPTKPTKKAAEAARGQQ
jgi:hypothetical protein